MVCQTTNLQIYTKYIHFKTEWITYQHFLFLYFLTHLPNFSTSPVSGNVRVLISLLLSDSCASRLVERGGKLSESFNPTDVHKNLHRCLTLASPVKKCMCKSLFSYFLLHSLKHTCVVSPAERAEETRRSWPEAASASALLPPYCSRLRLPGIHLHNTPPSHHSASWPFPRR